MDVKKCEKCGIEIDKNWNRHYACGWGCGPEWTPARTVLKTEVTIEKRVLAAHLNGVAIAIEAMAKTNQEIANTLKNIVREIEKGN